VIARLILVLASAGINEVIAAVPAAPWTASPLIGLAKKV